ncbi:MAG: hypothetical protein A4E55_01465 [Pelotomaculum sp. PtaU1.Bin035]|nr:MAG: hypothetical protein A4E55_01465 [Pelotomaculum sp. PtaU1.Bin035]
MAKRQTDSAKDKKTTIMENKSNGMKLTGKGICGEKAKKESLKNKTAE